jgi:hypothetical protein
MGVWLARIAAWRLPAARGESVLGAALQFMSASSPKTAAATRWPAPIAQDVLGEWDALQSTISELREIATAMGDLLS